MNTQKFLLLLCCLIIPLILATGCKDDKKDPIAPQQTDLAKNSCQSCHTNYDELKANYTPDPPATGHGCGGDAPHFEPYDRVYLDSESADYKEFKNSIHGKMECVACHNGVDNVDDRLVAHSGDFIAKPSTAAAEKCANCHPDVFNKTHNSIHEQGTGQKSMVTLRSGLGTGLEAFNSLSDDMKHGYKDNCQTCHATCGDCHVNRPKAGGGGLYKNHAFKKTPNMKDNCVACHVSRGGHAYYGVAVGTVPDVHLSQAGFTCLNCHSGSEIHGDGNYYDQRYSYNKLPKCSNCHTDIAASNPFHTKHMDTFSCNTCHSQDYNNCGSCHIGSDAGARIASHQSYKIGMNPLPDTKPFKFATLRRSLMAPDSWQNYGVPVLSNFDVRPTFKYTTPHNLIRWTSRTEVEAGKPCFDACHIITEGDTVRNKELYLFKSDLQTWEYEADKDIIVDDRLPAYWNVK